ncbi:MAG: hypothetical protein EAZ65_04090 [Verrucomicrobia bacterium]|nr:MAG: hypothetical protein EAZ84_02530 [Verrucomicrobiota bacterium]TAE88548.1 MAG: hypothetical protein EAZ82_04770 [Verrucomicrobiota bacterium]TAF27003.1 MAG: hypothetical protein EAZ71_04085 [Verrucomicrobiota bacterium]TAF42259.1 MAG: hypothetical protein EAZ65_04090 [Verrucomicrobiota bacterium]
MKTPRRLPLILPCLAGLTVLALFIWQPAVEPVDGPGEAQPSTVAPPTDAPSAANRHPARTTGIAAAPASTLAAMEPGRPPRQVELSPDFLDRIVRGDAVTFDLPDGRQVECEEARVERDEKGVVSLTGEFTRPVPGTFFFRRQYFPGVAGKMAGNVIFKGEKTAWKILPEGKNGDPLLKEVPIGEVICVDYTPPLEMPQDHPSTVALPEYQDVIPLESLPGAPGAIYLDFDGSKGPHDTWSYKGDAAPSGFSNSTIRDIWIRVAEDFLPFNINVTTDAKVYENATRGRRIRCIVTPTNWYSAGGVAYVGSYNWGGDPVCWASNYTGDSAVTVISHEVGHTLGLYHHGYDTSEYYSGHGSGATAWAPIMGTGYGKTLKHWSDGSYYLATRKSQKDLTTITNQNGVDFRPDDCGDALAGARYLWIGPGNTVTNQQGIIGAPGEIDAFRFKTTGGAVNLTASTATTGINLDIKADIVDAATSTVVFTNDSTASANATISTNLAAGEYLLRITGATVGTPATSRGGYSNYGCLGSYKIDGTVAGGETHQAFAIAENSANGTVIGTIAPRTVGGSPLSYTIASGNTGNILALNPSTGSLTVANSASLDFETLSSQYDDPAVFELFVTVTNTGTSATETVRAIVTVTDVNEPPVLAAIPTEIAVYEGTTPGVRVVDLSATDPDRFDGPVYEIVSGNSAGYFAINPRTGSLTVVNVPQVAANTPVTLVLRARDQKTPTQYSVDRTLTITITDLPGTVPGTPGTIVRTFFRNIGGSTVADLTGNANFPNKPGEEVVLTSFDGGANAGDNYGSTIRGYLIPPVSGQYHFWIAGDDASQLILGSGASQVSTPVIASHPTNTGQYAWDAQASQVSAPVTLTAGQPYYIEARHKEAGGGDHLAVAWSGPGITRQVIPGLYLVPFYQNYAPTPSGTFTIMETAPAGTVVGTASVADVNKQDSHENFTITAGNTNNVFAINPTSGQITVAAAGLLNANTTPFYNLTVRTTDDGTPALDGSGTVRVNINASRLYFDPNGTAAGSVADAGSYAWRTTSWATAPGGTAAVASWVPNAQAIFSATTPTGPFAYDVDIASYNTGTHGGFGAIRALGGTVRFVGNVDNFYLFADTAVEAAPGAAIEFNQTRSGNSILAFNLNSRTATFDGDVTFNNGGMGNAGNVVVNSGKLALNAANPYTGSTTVNSGTLSLLGSGAIYTTLNWANQTVTLNPGSTLELDRWVGANRSLGQLGYAAQNLVIDGATVRNSGPGNPLVTDDSPGFTIGTNGATLESATAGQMWRILTDNRNAGFGIASNGGPLVLTGAGDGSITKNISGTTTALLKTGPGTWHLGGTNTYGGGTTVSEGTLQCNNTVSLPGAATVESNSSDETKFGTLFMNLGNTTWSQDVSGSGLWKAATGSGSQTTVLSGNYSAFNGTLEVATGSGKIQLANAANYPAAGSTIQLDSNTTLFLAGGGTLQSDLRLFGGTIGEPSYGQLRVGAANAILNGDVTLHANTTIAADSGRTATINGVIGQSGGGFGFTKNQPGTLVLTADNTYTGGTTVAVGTLQTGATSGKPGPGNLTVANGATCQIRHTTGALGRQAYVSLNGTGKLDIAGGVTERVARLYVVGVLQAAGTYTAANLPSNLSGAGSLIVGEVVPDAPTGLAAALASWNAVRLNWSHVTVNDTSVRVERSLSPTGGFAEIASLGPGTSTYLDPGLNLLTPYYYRVRVSNAAGFSAYSEVAGVTTRSADPPADLTAVAGNAQVALSWLASDGATGYLVKRGTESGGPYTTVGTTAVTSFTDTTAANGTWYYYIVLATALGAESDPSDEVSARPLPPAGTGTWAADSGGNWSDPDNWQNFIVADGASNSATFGRAAGGTVTLDSAGRTLGSLNFAAGDYVLTGSPVALDNGTATPVIDVASNRLATIEPAISSTNGLRKTGGGRLIFAGGSSYTGSTSVDGGVLVLGNAYAGSAHVIASGAALELDTTGGDFSLPATSFTGTGTLRKSGRNRAFWGSSAATFALGSGSLIDVTGGTLVGGSNANEVWTNNLSDLSVASGAIFDGVEANVRVDGISGSGTLKTGYNGAGYANLTIGVDNGSSTFDGVIANSSSTGNLAKQGSGTITLRGTNTFGGSVSISGGVLRITRAAALGSGTKTVTINGSTTKMLELDGSGGAIALPSSVSFVTSGISGVIRNTAGNNSIAGAFTITDGNGNSRIISDGGALTLSGNVTANRSGRVLDLAGSSTAANTFSGALSNTNTPALTKSGTGTWIVSGANTYQGATTIDGGTLVLSGSLASSITTHSAILAPQGTPSTSANLTQNATSTYRVRVNAGAADRLAVGGSVTLAGTLDLIAPPGLYAGSSFTTLDKTSTGAISGTFAGLAQGASFALGGYTWQISYNGGNGNDVVLSITNGPTTALEAWRHVNFGIFTNTGTAADSADPDNDGYDNLAEFNAATNPNDPASPGSFIWTSTSSGPWTTGANWNNGIAPASHPAAKLEFLTGNAALPAGPIVANNDHAATFLLNRLVLAGSGSGNLAVNLTGGPLEFRATPAALPNLQLAASPATLAYTVANALTLAADTTFHGSGSGAFLFTGPISGPGALVRSGSSGTLVLAADNSYLGGTTISAGSTLQIGNDGATGSPGSGPIVNHGTLRIDRAGSLALPQAISGSGALAIDAPAATDSVTLGGDNSFSGAVTLTRGTLKLTRNSALGSTSAGTSVSTGAKIQLEGGTLNIPEPLSLGTGSTGVTIENLAGDNTLAGTITRNGALNFLSQSGKLTILSAIGGTSNSVNLQGDGDGLMSGPITLAFAVTKSGAGTWTLSGASSYTSATTISGGKLVLTGSLTSPVTATTGTLAPQGTPATTGTLAINSDGRLEARPGDTLTVGGSVTLAGQLDLVVPPGFTPGTSYTLLHKTSAGAVAGSFAGKPEAATFTAGGHLWRITYLGGDGNDVVLTIVPPLTAIESWRQTHFGDPSNSGNGSDSADPNHDGETNLLEFATGQNPHAATRAATTLTPSGTDLLFQYTRSKTAVNEGFSFIVEWSDTLAAPWTPAVSDPPVSLDATRESVHTAIPAGPNGRRFVRVRITPSP